MANYSVYSHTVGISVCVGTSHKWKPYNITRANDIIMIQYFKEELTLYNMSDANNLLEEVILELPLVSEIEYYIVEQREKNILNLRFFPDEDERDAVLLFEN